MKKALATFAMCMLIIAGVTAILLTVFRLQAMRPEQEALVEKQLPLVAVEHLKPEIVQDRFVLSGVSNPWEVREISSEISGKIEWMGVEEGDSIDSQADLLRINTTSIQARHALSKTEEKLAQQEYDRVAKLRKEGISSPQEYDQAATNLEASRSKVRMTEIELEQSVIQSEISGVIDTLYYESGEFVSVGMPLVRIVQVDQLKIVLGLPERDVIYCKPGQSVGIRFDAYPEKNLLGVIHRVATTSEHETRTFPTEIRIDNSEGIFKPGMIARALLVRKEYPNALTVPLFAIMSNEEERFVFVLEEDRAVQRTIEVGFFQRGRVLVTSGLKPGENVIVSGQRDLRDGQKIRVGTGHE
jgi:membrane fusion protein (multidrug efflux system)